MSDLDLAYNREPVCPHCGHKHADAWEWMADEGEHDCDKCEEPFRYTREVEVTYTTTKEPR
jgi:uncharacterized Zn-finger protein